MGLSSVGVVTNELGYADSVVRPEVWPRASPQRGVSI
jgi:hypothetical protein